jgi:CheY-like chemotaxis protein
MMGKANILVVEEAIDNSNQLAGMLQRLGYTAVETVPTGAAAIRRAAANIPDLFIVRADSVAQSDGLEAVGLIRARYEIPVILLGTADGISLEQVKSMGLAGYLMTPFTERELDIML